MVILCDGRASSSYDRDTPSRSSSSGGTPIVKLPGGIRTNSGQVGQSRVSLSGGGSAEIGNAVVSPFLADSAPVAGGPRCQMNARPPATSTASTTAPANTTPGRDD